MTPVRRTALVARLAVLVWATLYVLFLTWSLRTIIAPSFGYYGYEPRAYGAGDMVVAIAATSVVVLFITPVGRQPSHVAHLFLALTTAIPVIWTPLFYGSLSSQQVQNLAIAVATGFALIAITLWGGRTSFRILNLSRTTFWIWISLFIVIAISLLLASGLRLELTAIGEVYEQRQQYRMNVTSIASYLIGWLAGGTFPIVIAIGLFRRSPAIVSIGLTGVILLYALTANRSYIIGIGVLVGVYVMTRGARVIAWQWICLLSALILTVGLLDMVRQSISLTSLLVRRALTTAGINTANYVELFDNQEKYELRHSILSPFGDSPYEANPSVLVGSTYYLESTSANANFMADGFANFGWLGFLGASLLVGIFLRTYDKCAHSLPLAVSAPALVFVLLALANTAVLTVFLTHGGIVLLAWISLLPRGDIEWSLVRTPDMQVESAKVASSNPTSATAR